MDKKNTAIGVTFLLLAFAALWWSGRGSQPRPPPPPTVVATGDPAPPLGDAGTAPPATLPPEGTTDTGPAPATQSFTLATLPPVAVPAQALPGEDAPVLENEFLRVVFTARGGAIREIDFRKYPAALDGDAPYRFNGLQLAPALALTGLLGGDAAGNFTLESATADTVVYTARLPGGIEVRRTYQINAGPDPYALRHTTTLRNLGAAPLPLPSVGLHIGFIGPASETDSGYYLNVAHYDSSAHFTGRGEFESGFFAHLFGYARPPVDALEKRTSVQWASVKNQFFTAFAVLDQPAQAVIALRRNIEGPGPGGKPAQGLGATVVWDPRTLPAGGTEILAATYYAGPKELTRLRKFEQRQDKIMQFGLVPWMSEFLLWLLQLIHGLIPNWGWSIILLTAVVKTVLWPLNAVAARSAKRMGKLAPMIKELQAKYKDNPQRAGREQMELFRKYKANPLGGCIPILIQMPIFFGLYGMIGSASELRFADWLWVSDLSQPDTVARIFGFPVNVLPLLMTATMLLQMHLAPTPSVDPVQARLFKLMPLIFCAFSYFFASGLTLYWTVQNCFSILQQWLINRMPEPELVEARPSPEDPSKPRKKSFLDKFMELQEQAEKLQKESEQRRSQRGQGGSRPGGPKPPRPSS